MFFKKFRGTLLEISRRTLCAATHSLRTTNLNEDFMNH